MKRILILTLLILASLFALSACGGNGDDGADVGTKPIGSGCTHTWTVEGEPDNESVASIICSLCGNFGGNFPTLNDSRLAVSHGEDETVYTFTTENGGTVSYRKSHFTFVEIDGSYRLVAYSGNKANVVVPATYEGRAVTAVGMDYGAVVFNNAAIESISIPASVTRIYGNIIGEACTSLTSLSLPAVDYTGISGFFVSRTPTVEEVTIVGSEIITPGFLSDCAALKKVYLPASLRTVQQLAFDGCCALEDVYFAGTLAEYCQIDFFAMSGYWGSPFTYAENLYYKDEGGEYVAVGEVLRIPDGVTAIKPTAFMFFPMETLILPDSVTSVGAEAFQLCPNLKTVVLGSGLTSVGKNAFYQSSSIETVYYKGTSSQYGRISIDNSDGPSNYYLREAERFYYSEEGDLFAFASGESLWHFDEEGLPVLWSFDLTDTVDGKTYVHAGTEVTISDEYWWMLEMAEAQGMLEQVLEGELLFFYQNSQNKDEFEAKVLESMNTDYASLTASFADGSVTCAAISPYPLSYIEVDGERIYGTASEKFLFTLSDGNLILDNSNEHITVIITLSVAE